MIKVDGRRMGELVEDATLYLNDVEIGLQAVVRATVEKDGPLLAHNITDIMETIRRLRSIMLEQERICDAARRRGPYKTKGG